MAPVQQMFPRCVAAAAVLAVADGARFARTAQQLSLDTADLQPGTTPKPLLGSGDSPICGGGDIRRFLRAPNGADDVRNIPWSQVDAIATEYQRTQNVEIARLKAEVERLQKEIPLRERQEAPRPITLEETNAAVTQAVSVAESFGTLQRAQASKCGAAAVQPRPPKGYYQAAVATFQPAIRKVLEGGRIAVDGLSFRAACEKLLGVAPGDSAVTNCQELCQQFAEQAQRTSDELAGARAVNGKSSDQLRRELDSAQALLKAAVAGLEGCRQTQADLSVFRAQLQGLQGDITTTHTKLRDARDALMDAQYNLEDAQASVRAQEAESRKAQELLATAGALAQTALAKFQTAQQQTTAAQGSVGAATSELGTARTSLKVTQDATDALNRLKGVVSDSMLRMVMYFDDAVRRPVRQLGLGENVSVDSLFPANLTALASARSSRISVETLRSFCNQNDTRQALQAAVTSQADPRELCLIGDVAEISKSIDGAVSVTVGAVKTELREVQSWLDPYRGQVAVSRATVATSVQQGVPVGLHEVISIFSGTQYYRQYLQHWQLKGKFLEMYNALFQALRQAEATHGQAVAKLSAAKTLLEQAEKAQLEANSALEAAIKSQQVAQGRQQEAQRLLDSLNAAARQAQQRLDELERAVQEATRRWQSAKDVLQQTHKQGVSLVELLESIEAVESAEQ